MKPWEHYSTPSKHPWVTEVPSDIQDQYQRACWIWQKDEETSAELGALEMEFRDDLVKELGITYETYHRLNPYDAIIGCPENHEFPSADQYRRMYEYVKNKLES